MVNRVERGWAGHFICARSCLFRRNTLLEKDGVYIVVSSVGSMVIDGKLDTVGLDRYYETMAFFSDANDTRYHDIDVSRQIYFDSEWAIAEQDADDKANDMHETVVAELSRKLEEGSLTTAST
jgi:hypothetical protein